MSNFNELRERIVPLVEEIQSGHLRKTVQSRGESYQATTSILVPLGVLNESSDLYFLVVHLVSLTSTGDVGWCEQEGITQMEGGKRCTERLAATLQQHHERKVIRDPNGEIYSHLQLNGIT